MAAKFDREGIRYAYVTNGDVRFLEWACRTRRGCGITVMGGAHMVALVHLDDKWAAILDNNNVEQVHLGSARDADRRVEGELRVGGDADLHSGGSASTIVLKHVPTSEESHEQAAPECAVLARRLRGGCVPASPIPSTVSWPKSGSSTFRNDQGKWYVSVVGNATDARYNEIVGWFDTNASLKKLKNQVHFCPVTSDTAIYQARYAANVKGLPTVRMQKPDGTVVYEAAGKNLPMTAAGLNGALAGAVSKAQGFVRSCLGDGKWSAGALAVPESAAESAAAAGPEPQPIDDNGPPNVDPEPQADLPPWGVALVCVAGVLVGMAAATAASCTRSCIPP